MTDFSSVSARLTEKGYAVSCFATAKEASSYLNTVMDHRTIGFGGSVTLQQMGLCESLRAHNTVYWHWSTEGKPAGEVRALASSAEIYLTSVNGLSETGEIVQIDGTGNRVASMLYGHQKVYLIAGRNKLAPTLDDAVSRARNVAAPLNAKRLGVKTPCAEKGDRCYDCHCSDRICRALVTLWDKPSSMPIEVVLIDEELGY